jgi:hypothetical protein
MQLFTAPTLNLDDFRDAEGRTPTAQRQLLHEPTRRRRTMFPTLTYPTTQAHRDDLYRDARRRHRAEVHVREQLRRARRPAVIHRPRSTLIAGH